MSLKYKFFLFSISFIFTGLICLSQDYQEINSLKEQVKQSKDSSKVDRLIDMAWEYIYSHPDSATLYAEKALTISINLSYTKGKADAFSTLGNIYINQGNYKKGETYHLEALEIRKLKGDLKEIASSYNNIGYLYQTQKKYDTALYYLSESLKTQKELNNKPGIASALMNIGGIHFYLEEYDEATRSYEECLSIQKKLNNQIAIADLYGNIGLINFNQYKYEQAIEHYFQSLNIYKTVGNKFGIADSYSRIGEVYYTRKDYDKSLNYHRQRLAISKEINYQLDIAHAYNSLAIIFNSKNQLDSANFYYTKSLKMKKEMNDLDGIANTTTNLGDLAFRKGQIMKAYSLYMESLDIYRDMNSLIDISYIFNKLSNLFLHYSNQDYEKALHYGKKAYSLAKENNWINRQKEAALTLMKVYSAIGKYQNALASLLEAKRLEDTLNNKAQSKQIAELEARYKYEQKQKELEHKHQQENARQKAQIEKQRMFMISSITGSGLLLLLLFSAFRAYRVKRKSNIELQEKNEEISSQRDEIGSQRDLISRHIKNITDSIEYAYKIQTAIIPKKETIENYFEHFFIFNKPKDIVSGDFYWLSKTENKVIFAVADCTGHGVPGAFMSMLGITFLKEIVTKENITQPDIILNKLRENIIGALQQKGISGEQKDGMDITVCGWDKNESLLEYAGANNPLYLIRDNKYEKISCSNETGSDRYVLYEIKGDRMPVSIHERMTPFTLHKIDIKPGDHVYLFSDGFADQFGGQDNKKYKYKPFKKLLLSLVEKPLAEQELKIQHTFDTWKGNNKQIDDVLVMGIKL